MNILNFMTKLRFRIKCCPLAVGSCASLRSIWGLTGAKWSRVRKSCGKTWSKSWRTNGRRQWAYTDLIIDDDGGGGDDDDGDGDDDRWWMMDDGLWMMDYDDGDDDDDGWWMMDDGGGGDDDDGDGDDDRWWMMDYDDGDGWWWMMDYGWWMMDDGWWWWWWWLMMDDGWWMMDDDDDDGDDDDGWWWMMDDDDGDDDDDGWWWMMDYGWWMMDDDDDDGWWWMMDGGWWMMMMMMMADDEWWWWCWWWGWCWFWYWWLIDYWLIDDWLMIDRWLIIDLLMMDDWWMIDDGWWLSMFEVTILSEFFPFHPLLPISCHPVVCWIRAATLMIYNWEVFFLAVGWLLGTAHILSALWLLLFFFQYLGSSTISCRFTARCWGSSRTDACTRTAFVLAGCQRHFPRGRSNYKTLQPEFSYIFPTMVLKTYVTRTVFFCHPSRPQDVTARPISQ